MLHEHEYMHWFAKTKRKSSLKGRYHLHMQAKSSTNDVFRSRLGTIKYAFSGVALKIQDANLVRFCA